MIKTIIFDLDGVLVDAKEIHYESLNKALGDYSITWDEYHVDEKPLSTDFLLIDYIEIVRHGKFLDANVNSKDILNNILNSDENIKHKLKKFIN